MSPSLYLESEVGVLGITPFSFVALKSYSIAIFISFYFSVEADIKALTFSFPPLIVVLAFYIQNFQHLNLAHH